MQGHKRTARSERSLREGHDLATATPLSTRLTPSTAQGEAEDDEGANGAHDAPERSRSTAGEAAHRLLQSSSGIDQQIVYRNLWLFIWLKTIGSFDSGAFTAALGAENGIGETWKLTMKEQGVLTSSVFLGNVVGCPLAGHLFSRCDERRVLCGALVIHTLFTFTFAAMPDYSVALVNRFFVGLTLSFIVVYTPVWVDEFAPKNRQSVWMASHNAGVPLGIIMGYLLAVGPQMVFASLGWNWAFFIKCLLMIPTVAYVARVDPRTINTVKSTVDADKDGDAAAGETARDGGRSLSAPANANASATSAASPAIAAATAHLSAVAAVRAAVASALAPALERLDRFQRTPVGDLPGLLWAYLSHFLVSTVSFMFPLLGNAVYICSVISLTSLYFVATGLQNFVTQYLLQPPFNASMVTIMIGFGSAVVTAPVCGVIAGGILLDRIGGYKRNLRRVTLFLLFWGSCAVLFSVLCIFADTTRGFLLVMSVVLFCGGALIPPGAGLTMASLPDHLRSTGAAFAQTIYNLLGNFSGPMVCGMVADATGKLRYGIITLLLSSAFGVLPLLGIMYVAFRGGPLPGGLGGGGGDASAAGAEGGAAVATVLLEETYEMDSVAGEEAAEEEGDALGDEGTRRGGEAAVQGGRREGGAESTSPPLAKRAELPPPAQRRDTLGGQTSVAVAAASGVAGPPPPPQQQQPIAKPESVPSALTGAIRAWDAERSVLHGPGTAHPVMVPSVAATTTTAAAAAATTAAPPAVADVELLRLESEAAQVASLPSEQAYGMDLVRTWLSTQQQGASPDRA